MEQKAQVAKLNLKEGFLFHFLIITFSEERRFEIPPMKICHNIKDAIIRQTIN